MVHSIKPRQLATTLILLTSIALCGCGGGVKGGQVPTDRSTEPTAAKRSVRLNNYNNWDMDGTSAATLQHDLEMLARRDSVMIAERREKYNATPGWDGLTPQSLKALNPNIKVYRYYSMMSKSYPDTD